MTSNGNRTVREVHRTKRPALCMGLLFCLVLALAMPSLGQPQGGQGGPSGLVLPMKNDVIKVLALVLFILILAWAYYRARKNRREEEGVIVKEDTPSEPEAPIEPVETAEPVAEVTPISEPQETPAQADEAQVEAVPAETAEPDAATAQATAAQETHVQKDEAHSEVVPSESDEPVLKLAESVSANPGANLLAKHLMQTQVHWVSVDDTVNQAQTKMEETGVSYLLVGDGTKLEGIVTRSDLDSAASIYLRPMFSKWHRPEDDATLQIRLKWIMSKQVYPVKPETPLFKIVDLKCKHDISCLPVVDVQGKTLGIVTTNDMLKGVVNKELGRDW